MICISLRVHETNGQKQYIACLYGRRASIKMPALMNDGRCQRAMMHIYHLSAREEHASLACSAMEVVSCFEKLACYAESLDRMA